jgi:hypothetical protein
MWKGDGHGDISQDLSVCISMGKNIHSYLDIYINLFLDMNIL